MSLPSKSGTVFVDKAGREWPEWTPPDLVSWLRSLRHGMLPFNANVVLDERMQPVWRWFQAVKFEERPDKSTAVLSLFRAPLSFCTSITEATRMPGKPGNLPPKERGAYLQKVRDHASALIELLEGTRFSVGDIGNEIDPDKLAENVVRYLAPWGEDEIGHVVAFWVEKDGTYRMPWDYPDCHLVEQLRELVAWSREDDFFDRSIIRSSKPIVHAKSRSSRTIYFTCTLFEKMEKYGLSIPFGHLATIANVALELKDDETLDEDSARKQVRRYQARIGQTSPNLEGESDLPF